MSDNGTSHRGLQERLLLLALDPIHIGSGGIRLGRVDMAIAREPGTNLPKIPGTTLSGVARAYAAYRLGEHKCSGQGGHCGKPTCAVCYAFGSLTSIDSSPESAADGQQPPRSGASRGARTNDKQNNQRATAGTVNLFDAHILLFPVATASGPYWVSTKDRLKDAGFRGKDGGSISEPQTDEMLLSTPKFKQNVLNLGWLLLKARAGTTIANVQPKGMSAQDWDAIHERIALVSNRVFTQVVNSNLEVRTSVSINPTTGAAEDGALFTYEAIPRATWLISDLIQDDYRKKFDEVIKARKAAKKESVDRPLDVAIQGLELAEQLGVGGMGTRGFGRLKLTSHWRIPDKFAPSTEAEQTSDEQTLDEQTQNAQSDEQRVTATASA